MRLVAWRGRGWRCRRERRARGSGVARGKGGTGGRRSVGATKAVAATATAATMAVTDSLEPAAIWRHFEALASIPRPSKEEHRVLEHIKSFAEKHGLKWKQDDMGNMVVTRPGSAGGENAPTVIIQGHVDMVCEKLAEVEHNFSTDPIKLEIKGDWLTAVGTTLGADNGMGVAAGLALLEMPNDVTLPPIEGLFTVQEEIGLIGAEAQYRRQ